MKIWDISRALSHCPAPGPGDTPFHFELAARLGENAVVNVGAIRMSVHNGSHADARFHFEQAGWTIEKARLKTYLGPAVVVGVSKELQRGEHREIEIQDLDGSADDLAQTSRLLLKTGVWPNNT